jgi:hypothetical protein
MKRLLTLVTLLSLPAFLRADVRLEETRLTFGPLGPTRPSTKVLPGETLHVEFVVSGITKDEDGRVNASLAAALVDEKGKKLGVLPATSAKSFLALGGTTVTNQVSFDLPGGFPAGKYRVRAVLRDLLTGKEVLAEQPVEVVPRAFGAVCLRFANDAEGATPAGGNLTVNQQFFIVGRAVGFARKDNRIYVVGKVQIRDSEGRKTMPQPTSFTVDQPAPEDLTHVAFNFSLIANRPGRFTVQVELRDEIAKTTAVYELPLVVHRPPSAEQRFGAE